MDFPISGFRSYSHFIMLEIAAFAQTNKHTRMVLFSLKLPTSLFGMEINTKHLTDQPISYS